MKTLMLLFALGILLVLSGILYIVSDHLVGQKAIPTPTPISSNIPVQVITIEGTIIQLNESQITLKNTQGTYTFDVRKTYDIQQIISGSVAHGDAKTTPVPFSQLKTDQKVLVIAEKEGNFVRSIYILN